MEKDQGLAGMYLTSTASRPWRRKGTCSAGWGIGYGDQVDGAKHWRTKTRKGRSTARYPAGGPRLGGYLGFWRGWGSGRQTID